MSDKFSTETLRLFMGEKEPLNGILNLWSPSAHTRREEELLRSAVSAEEFEQRQWATVACNGSVMLLIENWKHPEGKEPPLGFSFPARWFWCLDQIKLGQSVGPLPAVELERVHELTRSMMDMNLPGLKWHAVHRVHFMSHGRGKPKAKTEPPPDDVLFFTFEGGNGVVAVEPKKKGGASDE